MADKKITKGKGKITKDMTFPEVMKKYPESIEVLFENGMHCVGCSMGAFETIEQGATMHGIDADKLVKEMNEKIGKGKGKLKMRKE